MKVFDASAVPALLFDEPGAELAARGLEDGDAVVSSVNQAEVLARLLDEGRVPRSSAPTGPGPAWPASTPC